MASALTTVTDVAAILRKTFTTDQTASVTKWIHALSAIIRNRVPTIDGRIESGQLSQDTVTMVIAFAVKRIDDFLSKSAEQTGVTYPEFGATFRQTPSDFSSFITASDWSLLGWFPTNAGAYSVPLGWPAG